MKDIKIIDAALRDGNHTVENKFNLDDIKSIVGSLDEAGLDYIEVGYGYGIGYFDQDGYPKDEEILKAATEAKKNSGIAIMAFPDRSDLDDLQRALNYDIDMVRIAVQSQDVSPAKDFVSLLKAHKVHINGFMMMAHRVDAGHLVDQAKELESYGVDSITVVDSAGYMEMKEVREKISRVRESISDNIEIGFHCHDNLGLAVGNSLAAIEEGATMIDTAVGGLGAGAGNTPTESLVACIDKSGDKTRTDLFKVLDSSKLAEEIARKYGVEISSKEDTLLLGYSGTYSTFMHPAKDLAKTHQADYREILMEAARRKLVPGQEDQLEEIAKNL